MADQTWTWNGLLNLLSDCEGPPTSQDQRRCLRTPRRFIDKGCRARDTETVHTYDRQAWIGRALTVA